MNTDTRSFKIKIKINVSEAIKYNDGSILFKVLTCFRTVYFGSNIKLHVRILNFGTLQVLLGNCYYCKP